MVMKVDLPALGRMLVTLSAVAVAIVGGMRIWDYYEVAPWTRNGRVKTSIVQVAPDVSGLVTKVHVRDNQLVSPGQVLFEIDSARLHLVLRQTEAALHMQRAALAQAEKEARRNTQLGELVSDEVREQGQAHLEQVRALLEQAIVSRDTAKLNLNRTRVVSPVVGYVTNLDLQPGAYASAGHPVLALVDRNAFYVEGYFEETKLGGIHIGDEATVDIMGQQGTLKGHVDSFAEGISDRDRSTGSDLLPNINPIFNWVRLAQRIPVRITLDHVPSDIRLIAGQSAVVKVMQQDSATDLPQAKYAS